MKPTDSVMNEEEFEQDKTFILDETSLPQQIDHAVGSIDIGGKKYRYYGTTLIQNVTEKDKEGKKTIKQKRVPALVLENGRIISQHSDIKGSFELTSQINLKNNRWSLSSIKSFAENKLQKVEFKEVFNLFKKSYIENMVFESNEWYDINALWDMTSYFYDSIEKVVIIKHEGKSGSAKSKAMKISSQQAFNGRKFLCPSPASFFRYRHHNKSMICIEEAEKLFGSQEKNTKNKDSSDLVEYLNGSYEKGNYVPRQNDKNISQTDEFDPFGWTRIGAINPLKGALEKRSITLRMIPAPAGDKRGQTEIPPETDKHFIEARNLAYINGLTNYQLFREKLNAVKNKYKLINREWLVVKPLLAMAECVDPNMTETLGMFIARLFERRDDTLDEHSWEKVLAHFIVEECGKHQGIFFLSNECLRCGFIAKINGGYSNTSSQRVNGIINTALGLKDFSGRNSRGDERGYNFESFKVLEILIRQGIVTYDEIKNILSDLSDCQIDISKVYNPSSDNSSDNLSDKKTENDFSDNLTDKTKKTALPDLVIDTISRHGKNKSLSTSLIHSFVGLYMDKLSIEDIHSELLRLKGRGEVVEAQPDSWRLV